MYLNLNLITLKPILIYLKIYLWFNYLTMIEKMIIINILLVEVLMQVLK